MVNTIFRHVKQINKKNCTVTNIQGIDFIYVINLNRNTNKWKRISDRLLTWNIIPYRFEAIDGWKLTNQEINEIGVRFTENMDDMKVSDVHRKGIATRYYGQPNEIIRFHHLADETGQEGSGMCHEVMQTGLVYFIHCMAPGTIVCAMSHISVIKDAYDSGYETVWIMEDDIKILHNPLDMSALIEELDMHTNKSWDILYTDIDQAMAGKYIPSFERIPHPSLSNDAASLRHDIFVNKDNLSDTLRKAGARFGCYSYLLRRCGMRKIIEHFEFHNLWAPIDFWPIDSLTRYTPRRDIIIHDDDLYEESDNGKLRSPESYPITE